MRHIVCSTTSEICTSYQSYLHSNHWKNIKARFKKSKLYNSKCFICERKKNDKDHTNFHIHHRSYINIGKELDRDLVLLCPSCHSDVHKVSRDKTLKFVNICFAVEYLKSLWVMEQFKKNYRTKGIPKTITLCGPWGDD
jgi:hypothetical protein